MSVKYKNSLSAAERIKKKNPDKLNGDKLEIFPKKLERRR